LNIDLAPCLALAPRYRLGLPAHPFRGLSGDFLSRGVGSSVEFQDFRAYVPGDDPRHIDWAAVARTDRLIVRLHRAEVRLSVEIILDASRSMAVEGGEKGRLAVQGAFLLSLLARRAAARVTVWAAGDGTVPLREDLEARLAEVGFEGRAPLAEILLRNPPRLEPGSLRIVLSDFLFPHDPLRLQAAVGHGAGGGAMVQILSPSERDPRPSGHVRLLDVETGEERQMVISGETARRYRERLGALQEGLAASCRAAHVPFALLPAESPIEEACRGPLLRAGVVEPF